MAIIPLVVADRPMTKKEMWRAELKGIVREVIKEELREHKHECRLNMSKKDVDSFNTFLHMVAVVGEGDLSTGIAVMNDNHRWFKEQRERSSKLTTAFFVFLIGAGVSSASIALWEGVKHYIRASTGGIISG